MMKLYVAVLVACFGGASGGSLLAGDYDGGAPRNRGYSREEQTWEDKPGEGRGAVDKLITHQVWKGMLRRASDSVDLMTEKLEEFGSVTVSSVLLTLPGEKFAFGLKETPEKFYSDAQTKKEGAAAASLNISHLFSAGVDVQSDPTVAASFVLQQGAFRSDQARYLADQRRIDLKNKLKDSAAQTEYEAEVEAALNEPDPLKRAQMKAAADRKLSDALPGNADPTRPTPPVAAKDGSNTPASASGIAKTPSELIAANEKLSALPTILPSGTFGIPDRAAVITAAGDSATQALFNFLSNPEDASKFKDKLVMVGVVTVAVDPGWRSKKNFAAQVSLRTEYWYQKARPAMLKKYAEDTSLPMELRSRADAALSKNLRNPKIPLPYGTVPVDYTWDVHRTPRYPRVAGVTPLMDSQVLDLQDQFRRQDAIALSLAGSLRKAGLGGQAQAFDQFVRTQQKEARTVSNIGTVNTFSSSGGVFGFQIGPRLKALADPASRRGGSANALDRQSFPAMLLYGLDRADLRPRLVKNEDTDEYEVCEPVLKIIQTTRWIPVDHKLFSWGDFYNPLNWHAPRFNETDRTDLHIELEDVFHGLANLAKSKTFLDDKAYKYVYRDLYERYRALRTLLNGSDQYITLPGEVIGSGGDREEEPDKASVPVVSTLMPPELKLITLEDGTINALATQDVYLIGKGLKAVKEITVGDATVATVTVAERGDGGDYIKVNVTLLKEKPGISLNLVLDPEKSQLGTVDNPVSVSSPPIFFVKASAPTPLRPVLKNSLKTVGGDGRSIDQTIFVNPASTDSDRDAAKILLLQGETNDSPAKKDPAPSTPAPKKDTDATKEPAPKKDPATSSEAPAPEKLPVLTNSPAPKPNEKKKP